MKKIILLLSILPLVVSCNFSGISVHSESYPTSGTSTGSSSTSSTSSDTSTSRFPPIPSRVSVSTSTSTSTSTSKSTSTSVEAEVIANDIMEASIALCTAAVQQKSSISIKFAFNNTVSYNEFFSYYLELDVTHDFQVTQYSTGSNKTNTFSIKKTKYYNSFAKKKSSQTKFKELTNAAAAIRKSKYTPRAEDFNTFAVDNYTETMAVANTEELWFAVSHGYKPTFSDTTTNAYKCYQAARNVCKSVVSDDMSNYEKYRQLYEWICENTTYDYAALEATDNWIYYQCYFVEGVFLNGVAVCDGYSKALNLLCGIEGIPTRRGFGYCYVEGEGYSGHAWNHMYIDDKWYLTCPTWGQFDCTSSSTSTIGKGLYTLFGTDISFCTYDSFLTKWSYFKDNSNYDFEEYIWSDDYCSTQVTDIFDRETFSGGDFDIDSQEEFNAVVTAIKDAGIDTDFCFSFSAKTLSSVTTSTFKTWFGEALTSAGFSVSNYAMCQTYNTTGYITYYTAVAKI